MNQAHKWELVAYLCVILMALTCAAIGYLAGATTLGLQDHDTCEYPVDEITAAYIRGYSEGVEDATPESAGGGV